MHIGIPKEIIDHEYRVALSPFGVKELVLRGHHVCIQTTAGMAIGYSDQDYLKAGAKVLATAEEIFENTDLIVKVKEPQPQECKLLKEHHLLFSYLHLAAKPALAKQLLASGCIAIAFETVKAADQSLPLLIPMSEVAGRMSVQIGAHLLEKPQGGKGILLSGVPGLSFGKVTIIGGGIVGTNAAKMALGLGANVTIIDTSLHRLRQLDDLFNMQLNLAYPYEELLAEHVQNADLVIGAVLIPGAAAPKLVSREMVKKMSPGSVIVDVAIDQGGCFETSRPTTHSEPTYKEEEVIHYGVINIPGIVARTSSHALENALLPYVMMLAQKGYALLKQDPFFLEGINVFRGKLTHQAVAEALSLPYTAFENC